MLENSKMVLNMVKDSNRIQMVINIKDSLLMVYLRVMVNIIGMIIHFIKVISNKDIEMDMEFGEME